jgi:hypothetical protein
LTGVETIYIVAGQEVPMRKKRERVTRLGLPEKSEKIMFAATPTEKAEIQKAARERGQTVSGYLLGLHNAAMKGGKS